MSKANLVEKREEDHMKKKLICEETVWTYSLRDPRPLPCRGHSAGKAGKSYSQRRPWETWMGKQQEVKGQEKTKDTTPHYPYHLSKDNKV